MSGWSELRLGVAGQRDAFIRSLKAPEKAQTELLYQIIERNRDSEFGERHDFRNVRTPRDYQHRVPPHDYDDIRTDLSRMMAGEKNVLFSADPLLFEPTGGSTGGSKFVPYNEAGLEGIRRAVLPWLDDLITSRPGVTCGPAYWSISPATRQPEQTSGGIPIGLESDAAYFGPDLAQSIGRTLAVPPHVASFQSMDEWRVATLRHLVGCHDLSFVSVWSPTFFLLLLDAIAPNLERIVSHIDGQRAAEVRDIFSAATVDWQRLWPKLDTVSCWNSSTSRRYAEQIADRFPKTHLQGKGLLATEGVITVPLVDAGAAVLAVNSAFYEFEGDDGDVVSAWELETDRTYEVVLTTAAGLYRYRLGDRVRVTGWYEAAPCLEFIGRNAAASDLCGEKLTEEFVATALGDIPGFGFLLPMSEPRPAYQLILDAAIVDTEAQDDAARVADERLMLNPQYRYAREIGQLPPIEARRINDPQGIYKRICVQSGQRLGDVKPAALASIRWGERFIGTTAK